MSSHAWKGAGLSQALLSVYARGISSSWLWSQVTPDLCLSIVLSLSVPLCCCSVCHSSDCCWCWGTTRLDILPRTCSASPDRLRLCNASVVQGACFFNLQENMPPAPHHHMEKAKTYWHVVDLMFNCHQDCPLLLFSCMLRVSGCAHRSLTQHNNTLWHHTHTFNESPTCLCLSSYIIAPLITLTCNRVTTQPGQTRPSSGILLPPPPFPLLAYVL